MNAVAIADTFVFIGSYLRYLSSRQCFDLNQSRSLSWEVHGFYKVMAELTNVSPNPFFSRLLAKPFPNQESDRCLNVLLGMPVLESHTTFAIWTDNIPCMSQGPVCPGCV